MPAMVDIFGAFVLSVLLALQVMQLSDQAAAYYYGSSLACIAQGNGETLAAILAEDLRKIGFRAAGTSVMLADSTRIQFLADLGADGTVDTLLYYVDDPIDSGNTPNPADRTLFRRVNSAPPEDLQMGVTAFRLRYLDAAGGTLSPSAPPAAIRQIRVDMTVESMVAYDTTYAKACVYFRIRPRNLRP